MTQDNRQAFRLIARLDIKNGHVIKGVQMEGWRKKGAPEDLLQRYYHQGADELLFMDVVATLYGRNHLLDLVEQASGSAFVPLTVGGGITSCDQAAQVMRAGADKIAINSAACADPGLLGELARRFGSQSIALSVEARRQPDGSWLAMKENGREHTGRRVLDWVKEAVANGAGEILLTSIDQDGRLAGMDDGLLKHVCAAVSVPVVASGGFHQPEDCLAAEQAGCSGVAVARWLHDEKGDIGQIKNAMVQQGQAVRQTGKIA